MKRPRKLLCFAAALLTAFLLTIVPAFADTGESTLQMSGEPARLIIQLGPGWAGTQFELRTDAGMYPGTVVVSDTGLLQMDLGGSKTFTLSHVQGAAQQADPPAAQATTAVPAADTPTSVAFSVPASEGTIADDVDLDAVLAALTEPGTGVPVEQPPPGEEIVQQEISIKHVLIFGGGLVAAIVALVILSRHKKRREYDDEEDDYED